MTTFSTKILKRNSAFRWLLFPPIFLILLSRLQGQNCNPDYDPPVAACDEFTSVAIGVDNPGDCYGPAGFNNQPPALGPKKYGGVTWIKAVTFDDGSYDNCNNVKFTVRRLAPYSNFINSLNQVNGQVPCNDAFPDFPSEFERAVSEQDSIKFYAGEVGTTQSVVLRVYQVDQSGTIMLNQSGQPIFNECVITVEVVDKIKPACVAQPDVTVSCENYDPSLWAYGEPTILENACLDTLIKTVDLTNFDTICNKGTLIRQFRVIDCSGNSSTCSQKIVVNYNQFYFVHFPNDVITQNENPNGEYGQPVTYQEDCELLAFSYSDQIFAGGPDADIKIERTWTIINWCTYDPLQDIIDIPNPNPNVVPTHPANLPGPIVSAPGTPLPWKSSIVKITPNDAAPTDFSTFWQAGANGYRYLQVIKILDAPLAEVKGRVFADSLLNCVYDAGDVALEGVTVRATSVFTGRNYFGTTNASGNYNIFTLAVDSVVIVSLVTPLNIPQDCGLNDTLHLVSGQSVVRDIPIYLNTTCPELSVGLSTPVLRRCFPGKYNVHACNTSIQPADNVEVEVTLDEHLDYTSSTIAYTSNNPAENSYRFPIGTLAPGKCQGFTINLVVNCSAPLGYTHCSSAHVFPDTLCNSQAQWSGADIRVEGACEGDSVRMMIRNIGTGNMASAQEFVVVEDIIMRESGNFQLNAGGEKVIKFPANGATWRLEAQEEVNHPYGGAEAVAVEGCGGLNTPGLVNLFQTGNNNPFEATDCTQNIGSFDPNDKQAVPVGYGQDHLLEANVDLEYLIRFQNTGTDTAFNVRIVDQLSEHLDPASVRSLGASHPFGMQVLAGGVIEFRFDNIHLPDSNINEAASHGYVKFRVKQKPDLPDGTVIQNNAAIYFDFNDPVITNTVFHTIGDHFIMTNTRENDAEYGVLKVAPNPGVDAIWFDVPQTLRGGILNLHRADGRRILTQQINDAPHRFERGNLPSGFYFYEISDGKRSVYFGKIAFN